jgi:hypothetical protein
MSPKEMSWLEKTPNKSELSSPRRSGSPLLKKASSSAENLPESEKKTTSKASPLKSVDKPHLSDPSLVQKEKASQKKVVISSTKDESSSESESNDDSSSRESTEQVSHSPQMSVTSATTTATSDPSQGYSHPPITK